MTVDAGIDSSAGAQEFFKAWWADQGLSSLANWAWQKILNGESKEQIMIEARATPEYKARFPGMEQLVKEQRAPTEVEYIAFEKQVRGLLHQWGMPAGIYDTPADIAKMLIGNVSAVEVNNRLQLAAAAVYSAPQEVRDALTQRYGITPGGLVAFYLDPTKAEPVLQAQYNAAQVTGAARAQHVTIADPIADELAARGVSYDQALAGFGNVAATQALGAGFGETAGQNTRTAAEFGDAAARTTTTRVQRGRLARFGGGGSLSESNQGVSGLGSSRST